MSEIAGSSGKEGAVLDGPFDLYVHLSQEAACYSLGSKLLGEAGVGYAVVRVLPFAPHETL